jgi:hypothetical protein
VLGDVPLDKKGYKRNRDLVSNEAFHPAHVPTKAVECDSLAGKQAAGFLLPGEVGGEPEPTGAGRMFQQ